MLQNTRLTAFTVSDLLRENQQGGGGGNITSSPNQIRVNDSTDFFEYSNDMHEKY